MLYPNSATKYLEALHTGLLCEISADIDYDHACGMMAIEIGKRLLKSKLFTPELVLVKTKKGDKLQPVIYARRDGFSTHMTVEYGGQVYDPLTAHPLPTSQYLTQVFFNRDVVLHPCGVDFTTTQLFRDEPTLYEEGLPTA